MSRLRKIAAHYTWCPRTGPIPRAILTFDGDGRLLAIDADVSKLDSMHGIEFYSGILIPGMVNAHCHLELSYLKGRIPPGTGLDGFVNAISAVRNSIPEEERIHTAGVQDSLMYREGITAVGDIGNNDFTFPLKRESSMHYHSFIELYGSDPTVAGRMLSQGKALAEKTKEAGLAYSLTPHSTYSVSNSLWDGILHENSDKKPLSIHFMESLTERELFDHRGAFAEHFREEGLTVDFTGFDSPADRLVQTIPADTPLLLIHNTFVSEEDIDRIDGHFRKVTWVICPRSNDYIEGAFPPVGLLRRKGCRIAVGTDSLSSNTSLSLLEELKHLSAKDTELPFGELIRWASVNGAEALGIENRTGTFETGKSPGAVLINHIDWQRMALTPESTARRII